MYRFGTHNISELLAVYYQWVPVYPPVGYPGITRWAGVVPESTCRVPRYPISYPIGYPGSVHATAVTAALLLG